MDMADGAERMDTGLRFGRERQPPPLSFAIDRHAVRPPNRRNGGADARQRLAERRRHLVRIKPAEEPLEGRLMRRGPGGEPELLAQLGRLVRRPLGDRQHGCVLGQDGGHRHRQDRGHRVASSLQPTRIGHGVEPRRQPVMIDTLHQTLLVHAAGREIPSA